MMKETLVRFFNIKKPLSPSFLTFQVWVRPAVQEARRPKKNKERNVSTFL